METYKDYLFDEVVSNQKIITFRLLSRHLNVHSQVAKEMLYDFHTSQNKTQPNSTHATYLLTGILRLPPPPPPPKPETLEVPKQDEDTIMGSSPFDMMATQTPTQTQEEKPKERPPMRSVIVVPQEKLEESKGKFERLSAVHVYSVEPAPLSDLMRISEAGHEVWTQFNVDEPAEVEQYGCIVNPAAKKKSGSNVPPAAAPPLPSLRIENKKRPASATPTPTPAASQPTKSTAAASFFSKKRTVEDMKKEESTPASSAEVKEQSTSPTEDKPKPEAVKRTASGAASGKTSRTSSQQNFMSNWKAGNKKQESKASSKAGSASTTPPNEPKLETDSEGEEEEEEPIKPAQDATEIARKKAEQKAALEAMMDDDDDDEFSSAQPRRSATPDEPMKDPTPPPASIPESTASTASASQPPARRRGKRKVMKKVQFKDDEGYLVTREEAVWESYSEDEPEPAPKHQKTLSVKAKSKVETDTDEGEDGKKGAKKPAVKKKGKASGQQGNIMSFFQKK